MKDHDIEPVNYAQPNWKHNARGIGCRSDWKGAKVYVFARSHIGPTKIIAYSLEDALFALESLENDSDRQWESENEGIASVQELSL
jgi:hypothetical protein